MKKYIAAIMIVIVTMMSFIPIQVQAEELDGENKTKKITVAFVEQEGLMEKNKDGTLSGYSYEIVMKIAQYANWDVEFVEMESEDINDKIMEEIDRVSKGEIDLITGMLYSDGLAEMFEYPKESYGYRYTTLIADQNNSDITADKLVSLKRPLKVAMMEKAETRNQELDTYCKTNGIDYTPVYCETDADQEEAIKNGSADVMLSISLAFYSGTKTVANFAACPCYMMPKKGNAELADEIDQALKAISYAEPDFHEKLQNKYFFGHSNDYEFTELEKNYLKGKKELRVLVPYEIAPLQYIDSTGEYRGVFVSFVQYLEEQTGLKATLYPGKERENLAEAMSSGDYDMAIGIHSNYEYAMDRKLILSVPLIESGMEMIYYRTVDPNQLQTATLAQNKTLPVYNEYQSKEQEYHSMVEALEAVEEGKADYSYGTALVIDYMMAEKSYQNIIAVPLAGQYRSYTMGFARNCEPELIAIVNKVIGNMDDSTMNAFLQDTAFVGEHSSAYYWVRKHPFGLSMVALLLSVMIAAVVISVFVSRQKRVENSRLVEESNAKSEFLSRMSHEIRTPLNSILGCSHLAKEGYGKKQDISQELDMIDQSGEFLLNLINDILDVSRIEADKIQLDKEWCRPRKVLFNAIAMMEPIFEQKGIHFEYPKVDLSKDDSVEWYVDPRRVQQILVNILSNAAKFTPEGGTVKLEIKNKSHTETSSVDAVSISDTGCGMSKEFISHIGEEFTQERNTYSNQTVGSGLGLFIVKKIIQMMGGTLQVESELGKGSVFKFDISYDYRPIEKNQQVEMITEDLVDIAGMHILCAEDNAMNQIVLRRLLESKQAVVTIVNNGQEALQAVRNSKNNEYDAILMDMRMPVMNGLEASVAIHALERIDAKTIPIIALSADAIPSDVKASKEKGLSDYLTKPIVPKELYETLAHYKR